MYSTINPGKPYFRSVIRKLCKGAWSKAKVVYALSVKEIVSFINLNKAIMIKSDVAEF